MSGANYSALGFSSDQNKSTKRLKTPNKTPLRLSSHKKTPNTLTNDRYIPNRSAHNMEASYHILVSDNDQENINANTSSQFDNIKRKLINDTCQGSMANEKVNKVLNLHVKQPNAEQVFAQNIKMFGGCALNSQAKKQQNRQIQVVPEKILDAPEFLDDFCKCLNIRNVHVNL